MKAVTVILFSALVIGVRGYLIKVPTTPLMQPKIAPIGWVHVQKLILPLFENICEESRNPIIVKLSPDFKLDTLNPDYSMLSVHCAYRQSYIFFTYINSFRDIVGVCQYLMYAKNPEVIKNLLDLKNKKGLLPKNEIFTEYKIEHLNEFKIIYDLFYYASDFNTFYKSACWARQNINCGLFIDALYSAILNRKDTQKVIIPAPYEILPNYFIRKDYMIRASTLMAGDEITPSDSIRNDGNSYILDVNYTTQIYENADEAKLEYFYEDIGLNSYYYLTKLKMSTWINSNDKNNRYGEYLYSLIKQLTARYNLDRYSNGLSEVEAIDWDNLNTLPNYDPMLIYSDGNDFSYRTLKHIENNEKLTLLKTIENNVATVVSHMREGGFSKSYILNHLMEILVTSEKSYENLALQILNDDIIVNNSPPSVLGHYMTTLRDPAFWAINKKIVDIVDNALKVLPGYTKNELYFPGVEIINVEVKKMMTSFENFAFDITDALKTNEDDTKFKVKISLSRLSHKPFSLKVNITSLVSQKGLLRIYLGPKIMPGEHVLKKNLFMLLDCFEIDLKFGNNIITRTSADISDNSDDLLSLYTIRKKIADTEFGLDSITKLKSVEEQIKFPSRLIIPKGVSDGLPLQLFVFVVPFGKSLGGKLMNTGIVNRDTILSPGFPLDLDVEVQQLFDLPNALVKDILVIHKESFEQTTNYGGRPGINSWQNNDYLTPTESIVLPLKARPDFTLRKEPLDYKSKRGQYGKNEDYAAKKGDYKYKKDYTKTIDRSFVSNNDKYITNLDITTRKINTYISDDVKYINKDNFNLITTDQSSHEGNTFWLDKKIQDKGIDEEVLIDVASNEKVVLDKTTDFDEVLHKVIIKNGTIGTHDKTLLDKADINSDEVLWSKTKNLKIIDVTNDSKDLADVTLEDSAEDTEHKKININEIIDISKTIRSYKRLPTLYDLVFYPFYDTNISDEQIYE